MRIARRIFTHLLTAVLTAAVVSLYWYGLYGPDRQPQIAQKDQAEGIRPTVPVKPEVRVGPAGLAIPVAGVEASELTDTFAQARAGGTRVHDAIDIMAPHGTPVVAAARGTVEKLFYSRGGGGITAYVRSDDGRWIYYYAHLQEYAPGLREGQRVEQGDLIGTVGSSGNASPEGPHLHFAVHRLAPDDDWHSGSPVNPYPLLAG